MAKRLDPLRNKYHRMPIKEKNDAGGVSPVGGTTPKKNERPRSGGDATPKKSSISELQSQDSTMKATKGSERNGPSSRESSTAREW